MSAIPIVNEIEVRNRLEEFGVTKEQLAEVVDAAILGRRSCTAFDPKSAPGWRSWCDGNRRLREMFVPIGWELDEKDGIPSVVNRKLGLKITVCNTDAGTAKADFYPQQTSKKGAATEEIINRNQYSLFDILESATPKVVPFSKSKPTGRLITYYLCVYCFDEIVRAELSCPVVSSEGLFKEFIERIFLTTEEGEGGGVPVRKQAPDDGDSGLDIPVIRKQAAL